MRLSRLATAPALAAEVASVELELPEPLRESAMRSTGIWQSEEDKHLRNAQTLRDQRYESFSCEVVDPRILRRAAEMARVEAGNADPSIEVAIVAAGWLKSEFAKDLRNGP